MLSENENTYLAKWLNNELSTEDLEELKRLPEYEDYKKIIEGLTFFNPPSFDLKESLQTTLDKLDQPKKGKVIWLKPLLYAVSAAAAVVLIVGIFFNTVSYSTTIGEQLAITLPDGSTVDLNASSSLTHTRFFWSQHREIELDGEAFFKVTTGTNFKVVTKLGQVEVLGTQFNVKNRSNEFQVGCYEGKVRVSSQKDSVQKILEKGEGVSLKGEKLIEEKVITPEPLWKKGESIFESTPLINVLDELERQYNISFRRDKIDQNQLFTGGFRYDNLDLALESVLVPMGIEYVINGTMIVLTPK